jgi:hypothetical protein
MAITLASAPTPPNIVWTQMIEGGIIKYAANISTDANGAWAGVLPEANLAVTIQNRTAGEFANSVSVTGTSITVGFKKFKSTGLGITLGTLLSVSAFEDVSGVVNFDIIAVRRTV